MKFRLSLVFYFFIFISSQAQDWTQIGATIFGGAPNDWFGNRVSLSDDGFVIAVGAPNNDVNGNDAGIVKIFKNNGGIWNQIGNDIYGEAPNDMSGIISINADGTLIAIGAPYNCGTGQYAGHVRVFKYINGNWNQIGSDINGKASDDFFGASVSISADGSIVAVGAPYNDDGNKNAGHVRVFKNNSGTWTQIGNDIKGTGVDDWFGWDVKISSNGLVIAVGAPVSDLNGADSGHVRIYKNNQGVWSQIGNVITGENAGDMFGYSIGINNDGSIVAIGAGHNDGNGDESGQIKVFKNELGQWSQIGSTIYGKIPGDNIGTYLSLSSDGNVVATFGMKGIYLDAGLVRMYKNLSGNWVQIGNDINGTERSEFIHKNPSLNNNGSIVAIGSPINVFDSNYSGKVQVYTLSGLSTDKKDELENNSHIFLNYHNNKLSIFSSKNQLYNVRIIDCTGKQIYNNCISQKEKVIDMFNYSKGIYIVYVFSESGIISNKIYINK
jgi:hypothetical protein